MIVGNLNNWWRLVKNEETGNIDMVQHRIWYLEDGQPQSSVNYREITKIQDQYFVDIGNGYIDNMWRYHEYRLIHRTDGPAVEIEDHSSYGEWFQHGKYHRTDGPCKMSTNGDGKIIATWMIGGKHHREDGPAYEVIGDENPESHIWYINGIAINIALFKWLKDHDISPDWKTWTTSEKTFFKFKFM